MPAARWRSVDFPEPLRPVTATTRAGRHLARDTAQRPQHGAARGPVLARDLTESDDGMHPPLMPSGRSQFKRFCAPPRGGSLRALWTPAGQRDPRPPGPARPRLRADALQLRDERARAVAVPDGASSPHRAERLEEPRLVLRSDPVRPAAVDAVLEKVRTMARAVSGPIQLASTAAMSSPAHWPPGTVRGLDAPSVEGKECRCAPEIAESLPSPDGDLRSSV